MLYAPASHINQGPAYFNYHGPQKEVRRSRRQALHSLLPTPPVADSSGTTSAGSIIVYITFLWKVGRNSSSVCL
ncbi:hypothetical protein AXF42_Ash013964 [Apostasia shenzhenica]|uniref:Uncharacterized protein n=1 Tax=Apostasia shenzhenica TaxID=1088818 RepID=A0A2I0ASD2_9ASPA|nr:hypothetical protein AXF42_Ash013964 [Apostasia shenzhenica]